MLIEKKYIRNSEDSVTRNQGGAPTCKPRLKFWQAVHFFKCPIVGMCLTFSEQRRLIKRTGFSDKGKSPFELHEMLVASSDSENALSRRIDSYLNRKFSKAAAALLSLDDQVFMPRFKAAIGSGQVTAVLWGAAVNPKLSIKCRKEIFGEIHMAMHCKADQVMKLKYRLSKQRKELCDMRQAFKEKARQCRRMQKEVENHKQDQATLQDKIELLERKNSELPSVSSEHNCRALETKLKQENRKIRDDNEDLSKRIEFFHRQVHVLKGKNNRLSVQLAQQIDLNRHFKMEVQMVVGEMASLNRCDENCPAFDLCKKRILIVGGITRMESLYRNLVEGSGGVFEYHDGYVKKGAKGLECQLKRADVVLCPVSCNSHAACSIVKNLGKKHKKPVYLLPNSSLSTVSKVIRGENSRDGKLN